MSQNNGTAQAWIPVQFGPAPNGGPATPSDTGLPLPNVTGTAETFAQFAYDLDSAGHHEAAQFCLDKAVLAERSGGTTTSHLPTLGGEMMNLDQPLLKSLARNALSPNPTPYRINETLFQLGAYTGIREPTEASNLTFEFLRKVARFPLLAAIIGTRQFQVTRFAKIPRHERDTGFEIHMKDTRAPVTRAARKRIEELQNLILHGGYVETPGGQALRHSQTGEPGAWDGNEQEKAVGFYKFLSKLVEDSLAMDWACYRMEPSAVNPKKFPVTFFSPVNSAMIRRTMWQRYRPQVDVHAKYIQYVELHPASPGGVVREYTWERLAAMVRNPRIDFWGQGYGLSEVEIVLDLIASMILSMRYQREYFDNNHIPPGIVSVNGIPGMSEQALQTLRQQIMQSTGGVDGFFKLIYLFFAAGQGNVQYTPLRSQSGGTSEMAPIGQYNQGLLQMCLAVFRMSGEEIGFPAIATSNPLQQRNPEATLEHSTDKGLKPLLDAIAASLNEHIIFRIDPDFTLTWANAEDDDLQNDLTIAQSYFNLGWTHNEIRNQMDVEHQKLPLDRELYDKTAAKFDESKFPTAKEWQEKVEASYEKQAAKSGMTKFWSACRDIPAGNAAMMFQFFQGEVQEQQQAVQQQQQMAQYQQQGYDTSDPNVMAQLQAGQQAGGQFPDASQDQNGGPGGGMGGGQNGYGAGANGSANGGGRSGQNGQALAVPPAFQNLPEREADDDDEDEADQSSNRVSNGQAAPSRRRVNRKQGPTPPQAQVTKSLVAKSLVTKSVLPQRAVVRRQNGVIEVFFTAPEAARAASHPALRKSTAAQRLRTIEQALAARRQQRGDDHVERTEASLAATRILAKGRAAIPGAAPVAVAGRPAAGGTADSGAQ